MSTIRDRKDCRNVLCTPGLSLRKLEPRKREGSVACQEEGNVGGTHAPLSFQCKLCVVKVELPEPKSRGVSLLANESG
jgi:hypothetical protein